MKTLLSLFLFLSFANIALSQYRRYELITDSYLSSVDTAIFLERTGCYGECPVYRLCVQCDGMVLFEGLEHTKELGVHRGQITSRQFFALLDKLTSLEVFSFRDRYGRLDPDCKSSGLDAPSATVLVKLGDQSKRISHYFGCRGFSHESDLFKIEHAIDEAANSTTWVGSN